MRTAIFSDTHGNTAKMIKKVQEISPELIIHLGDYERDTLILKEKFPDIPIYNVRGNCDITGESPLQQVVDIGPVKALLTHGHLYDVKWGNLQRLAYAAMEAGARIALFGHTHQPCYEDYGNIKLINPGTAGQGKDLTWAFIEVKENGAVFCDIRKL